MAEPGRLRLSPAQVGQLATLLDGEGVRTLQLDTVRGRLEVRLAPDRAPLESVAESPGSAAFVVTSTTVGEFLTAHPSHQAALVRIGDPVAPGDVLGFVRIGMLLAAVTFDAGIAWRATLAEVLAQDRALVGYGTPLFRVVQR